jgi:D-methionine transport system permease protein
MQQELITAFYETLIMVFVSGLITLIIGLPLGILLALTRPDKKMASGSLNYSKTILHKMLTATLRSTQSLPYVVLMIILMPVTGVLIGKEQGWFVAILPLSLATIPYFANQCQQAFNKIPEPLLEYMTFLGASPLQMISKVLLPETWPQLIQAFTHTLIQLIGYSVIAGLLGASGLGGLAIQKGYPTFQANYIFATAIILILLIQSLQGISHYLVRNKKIAK